MIGKAPLSRLSIGQKGLLLISVPLIFELVIFGVLAYLLHQSELQAEQESRSRDVIATVRRISSDMTDAGTGLALYWMTKDEKLRVKYETLAKDVPLAMAHLKVACRSNPEQLKVLDGLEASTQRCLKLFDMFKASTEEGGSRLGLMTTVEIRGEAKKCLRSLTDDLSKIEQTETERGSELPAAQQRSRNMLKLAVVAGTVANALLAIAITLAFSRSIVVRVRQLQDNSRRFAKSQELSAPLEGTDEIAELDKVFRQMAAELRASADMRKQFVAMISHDLRSPLTALQISLELFIRGEYGDQNETALYRLRTAHRTTGNLIELINDLLDLERSDSGLIELKKTSTDMETITDCAVESVESMASKAGVSFEREEIDGTPIMVDEKRLVRVLMNLLSNAIKFSQPSTKVIMRCVASNGRVEYHVIDQGCGIEQEELPFVFDRFRQASSAAASEHVGSGLGLANCRAIVQAHGGEIGVNSELGKGSDFWFTIPI